MASEFNSAFVVDLPRLELIGLHAGTLLIRAHHRQPMSFLGPAMSAQPAMVGGEFAQMIRSGGSYVDVVNQAPWQNSLSRWDVNQSGSVTSRDALLIINQLQQEQGPELPAITSLDEFTGMYVDVSGDGRITALDALLVLNELRRVITAGEAEAIPVSYLPKSGQRPVVDQPVAANLTPIDGVAAKIASFADQKDAAIRQLYVTDAACTPSEETEDETLSPLSMPFASAG